MMKAKEKAVSGLTGGIEMLFRKNKVTYLKGKGRIAGAGTVNVDLKDGGKEVAKAKHIIIATGSEPSPFPGFNVDQVNVIDSTGALSLSKVPKKMVVVGGGVIGLELVRDLFLVVFGWFFMLFTCFLLLFTAFLPLFVLTSCLGLCLEPPRCRGDCRRVCRRDRRRHGRLHRVRPFLHFFPFADVIICSKAFHKLLQKQGIKFRLSTKVIGTKGTGKDQKVIVEAREGGKQEEVCIEN